MRRFYLVRVKFTLEKLVEKYYKIENYGFEAAASIYSISDTNVGGNLGDKSNQISKIYDEIKIVKKITKPIKQIMAI